MVSYRRMKCGYRAFLRRFIIPQPFENRLAHSAALGLFHIFDGTYEHRGEPHRVLISRRRRKRRSIAHGNGFDTSEILTAHTKRYMPATDEAAVLILSENKTCHVIFLWNITAYHKVLVFEIFTLDPILCTLVKIVEAVFPLCDNPLQVPLFGKIIKSDSFFFDISRFRKPRGLGKHRLIKQLLPFRQRQKICGVVLTVQNIKGGKAGGELL